MKSLFSLLPDNRANEARHAPNELWRERICICYIECTLSEFNVPEEESKKAMQVYSMASVLGYSRENTRVFRVTYGGAHKYATRDAYKMIKFAYSKLREKDEILPLVHIYLENTGSFKRYADRELVLDLEDLGQIRSLHDLESEYAREVSEMQEKDSEKV